jgi:uncharacterized protein YegP (UPF0339 family)
MSKRTSEFKIEIGTIYKDEKRDITIIDREYRPNPQCEGKFLKYYKYKCGWNEGWTREYNFKKGQGCSACAKYNAKPVLGINTIWDTDKWMCDLGLSEEDAKTHTHRSHDKVQVFCPDCGQVKNKKIEINTIYVEHSIACPRCSDKISFPNKIAFYLLQQLKIDFETEYNPDWIKPRRYDFYFKINNKEYILEMDGEFHYKDNKMNGQTVEESKAIDNYKDRLANEHGIEVIRINCELSNLELIKQNILKNSKLNELFDLSNIDWLKCEEYACSNLVKVVCEIKRDNPDLSTIEIGKLMKLNCGTIRTYLIKGSKIWDWINYDGKEEKRKSSSKAGKASGKPVEIFKDGISLGIFESARELERQSLELFGVKLLASNISQVCNNKRNFHKGYTFKNIQ